MAGHDVAVVGSGVSGLTTALCLLARGVSVRLYEADASERSTSSVPPAMWFPYHARPQARVAGWARWTHRRLVELATDSTTGVVARGAVEIRNGADPPQWRDWIPGCRPATVTERPANAGSGWWLPGFVLETPVYLPWLRRAVLSRGAVIERARVADLAAVAAGSTRRVVVNCTGLGAAALTGDRSLYPSRGQLLLVEALPLDDYIVDETEPGAITYVVPRRDGTVIGATVEDRCDDDRVRPEESDRLLARAARWVPGLTGATPLAVRVGLRPCRPQVRLELERLAGGAACVHNYGHGGSGFTMSWGCAEEAAGLAVGAVDRHPADSQPTASSVLN